MTLAISTTIPRLANKTVWSFNDDGTVMDLAAPDPRMVRFDEMARRLAGIRRFNGRGIPVAQHSVMGAQAIINEGGTSMDAAFFLLHDGHEYVLGDIVRPAEDLLAGILGTIAVREAVKLAKSQWDEAIYTAARLIPPSLWTMKHRKLIKSMDDRMCRAEAMAFFGAAAARQFPDMPIPKTTGAFRCWGEAKAEETFLEMARSLIGRDNIEAQHAIAASARRR